MTENTQSANRLLQVAVIGSSADVATEAELALAESAGKCIAERQFVLASAGDDGVMGAAAAAAKYNGGRTVAILPRGKTIKSGWMFDAVVDTGLSWIQFSDVLLRSCRGALIIGGGAGTLGELAMLYLNEIPGAFLGAECSLARSFGGGRHLDTRKITSFPCFDHADEALDHIISGSSSRGESAETALQRGREIHFTCYPYGSKGDYLPSAFSYSLASAQSTGSRTSWLHPASLGNDALGDHEYYHARNFFRAASYYSTALQGASQCLSVLQDDEKTDSRNFISYLRSMVVESAALAFDSIGEAAVAVHLSNVAADLYESAISTATPQEEPYLRHSSLGLRAFASYMQAAAAAKERSYENAAALIESASRLCDEALQAQPVWRQSGFSDSYQDFARRIAELKAEIDLATGAGGDAPSNS